MNHDLHRGFQAGELRLYFQPQVSLDSGEISALEVLLRWHHPERGLLSAGEIIPIAEECGMIVDIGTWVLLESCAQLARWNEMGLKGVRLAVNVSALQIHKSDFVDIMDKALRINQIAPGLCEIEITESTLQYESNCVNVLEKLKEMGVPISIDDFGTGYSCLSSLKHLPISKLKIDRSFVADLGKSSFDMAIVEAVIAMAQKLSMEVLAEGVETADQAWLLRKCGCDNAQGYYFHRPMPAEQVEVLLRLRMGCA